MPRKTRLIGKTVKFDRAEVKWVGNFAAMNDLFFSQVVRRAIKEFREREEEKRADALRDDNSAINPKHKRVA